jgi:hypothetical protein
VEAGVERVETLLVDLSGSGAVGLLEAEVLLNESFAIVGDVGYRHLSLDQDDYSLAISNVRDPAIDGPDADDIPEGRDLSPTSILRHAFILEEDRPDELGLDLDQFRLEDFKVDFSGVQANIGLRIYIF